MTSGVQPGISALIPVYGGGEALQPLVARLRDVLLGLGRPFEIILVDDASAVPTSEIVREIAESVQDVILLRLATNSGQHAALLAGVRAANYEICVTLDDDLQNPPEHIPILVKRLDVGDLDVVFGQTFEREQSWFRRTASRTFRRVLAWESEMQWILLSGSFRAFRTELRCAFAGAVGPSVSLSALLSWSTQRMGCVQVRHDARQDGKSGYSVRKLVRIAFDTLTGYSTFLLNVVTVFGFVSVMFGLGILAWVLSRYLYEGVAVAGFSFLASSIALFSGVQMLSLGIIGQYLGRIHMRVQGRPSYYIAERVDSPVGKNSQGRTE